MTFGRSWLPEWGLDPSVTYLNHGTVGAPPLRVLREQQVIRDAIERQPSRYILRELTEVAFGRTDVAQPRLRAAAEAVAAFVGARGADVVFVDNATTGANAVLQSFPLDRGDEVLVTDLGYGGVVRAATYAARRRGAVVRVAEMPYPFRSDDIAAAIEEAVGPRTRIAIIDHITADTALVLPLRDIAQRLRARGVAVLADGAHAPGAIALDIPALGLDWYVGNLHKWAWTPRSCAVLWAAPERQESLHPTVISWGLDEGFTREFDMVGTRDPTPYLAAPAALALFDEWGLEDIRSWNHDLAWRGARHLAERWQVSFDTPESMIGTMAALPLPESCGRTREEAVALRDALLFDEHIEVHMHAYRGRVWARISAQIYNDMADVDRLAEAVLSRA
jgi:isopenicillin-N epimerase